MADCSDPSLAGVDLYQKDLGGPTHQGYEGAIEYLASFLTLII
jgi:hypothetical protein